MGNGGSADSANGRTCNGPPGCASGQAADHSTGCPAKASADGKPLLTRRAGRESQAHEKDNADFSHGFLRWYERIAPRHQETPPTKIQARQQLN
jgi:hypothetical protein